MILEIEEGSGLGRYIDELKARAVRAEEALSESSDRIKQRDFLIERLKQLEQLAEQECLDQAHLLGISSNTEARLRTRIDNLEAELYHAIRFYESLDGKCITQLDCADAAENLKKARAVFNEGKTYPCP